MPIYEYQCPECGEVFSHLHRRLNEEAPACPKCNAHNVKRKYSTFSASVQSSTPSCPNADACHAGEHHCCPGCCHHH